MICTFYSFKGGVGRSMALANVATCLALQGVRVVMVDWDLEAPGLESYFFAGEEELDRVRSELGVIDLLLAYKRQVPGLGLPDGSAPLEDVVAVLEKELPPLSGCLVTIEGRVDPSEHRGGGLRLLTAGWRAGERFAQYAQAVQGFDWSDFYARYAGEAYFEWLRRQLTADDLADVVLIDSRTGVTEMGGVCTRQLADVVVLFCAPNLQNLTGSETMARSFVRSEVLEARGRPIEVIAIPTRVDNSEIDERNAFERAFNTAFPQVPLAFRRASRSFWSLRIPYLPKYSYVERLAVGDPDGAVELKDAYENLTSHLLLLSTSTTLPRGVWGAGEGTPRSLARAGGGLPAVWNCPLPRNPHFVGRQEALSWLEQERSGGRPLAIYGMAGVGKTAVVVSFIYDHLDDYEVIWWIRSERERSVEVDLTNLARALGIVPADVSPAFGVVQETIERWLSQHERWLVVFDGVSSASEITTYLPNAARGHVFITSRSSSWGRTANCISLPPLSLGESEDLLSLIVERPRSATDSVAELLGGLPLALEQAAAYLEATGRDAASYIGLYHAYPAQTLQAQGVQGQMSQTVWEAFDVSLEAVEAASPTAYSLLCFFAFFGSFEIPLDVASDHASLVPEPVGQILNLPFEFDTEVANLRQHSLLESTGTALTIHPLVQAVLRERMDAVERERWATAAVRVLDAALPRSAKRYEGVFRHAEAACRHAAPLSTDVVATASLRVKVAQQLGLESPLGAELLEEAVRLAESYTGGPTPAWASMFGLLRAAIREVDPDRAVAFAKHSRAFGR